MCRWFYYLYLFLKNYRHWNIFFLKITEWKYDWIFIYRCGFPKVVTLLMYLRRFFVRYKCFEVVFCTSWMSKRRLLYVKNVLKKSFECCECINDIFRTLCLEDVYRTLRIFWRKESFVLYEFTKTWGKKKTHLHFDTMQWEVCFQLHQWCVEDNGDLDQNQLKLLLKFSEWKEDEN